MVRGFFKMLFIAEEQFKIFKTMINENKPQVSDLSYPVVISHSKMLLVSVIILATPKLPCRGGGGRRSYVSVSNRDMFSQINWHSCSEGQEAS